MQPEILIAFVSFGSVGIPLSIALAHWRRLTSELLLLSAILMVSLGSDILSVIVMYQFKGNTHLIGNIYLIAQFSLLILILRKQFSDKRFVDIVFLCFIIFYAVNISFFQGPLVFNSVSNVFASLILIALSLYYFYRLLNDLPTVHIQSLPMLWISFAALTYYAGNFFLFLVSNYLVEGAAETHRMLWILHNLLNIIKNGLFAVALWQSYRKVKSSTLSSSAP